MKIWVNDPKDGSPSVSLTLLVISFIAVLAANVLQMLGKISNCGSLQELLYAFVALYFSRRFNFAGKSFTSDPAEDAVQKVNEVIKQ